jgi:hypothetical protein
LAHLDFQLPARNGPARPCLPPLPMAAEFLPNSSSTRDLHQNASKLKIKPKIGDREALNPCRLCHELLDLYKDSSPCPFAIKPSRCLRIPLATVTSPIDGLLSSADWTRSIAGPPRRCFAPHFSWRNTKEPHHRPPSSVGGGGCQPSTPPPQHREAPVRIPNATTLF